MKLKFCQPQTHVIGPIVILSLIDNLRLELVSLNLKINFPHSTNTPFPTFTILYQTSFFLFATAWCFYRRSAFRFFNCFYSNTHNTTHILPHHLQKPQKKLQNFKNPQKVPHSFKTPPKNVSMMYPFQTDQFFFSKRHF